MFRLAFRGLKPNSGARDSEAAPGPEGLKVRPKAEAAELSRHGKVTLLKRLKIL